MSDKLKKLIQRSKSKFDLNEPRPDLFYKIMDKMVQNQKTIIKSKPQINNGFKWIAVAASLTLLIVCSLFFYLKENKLHNINLQLAENPYGQIQNRATTNNPVLAEQTIAKQHTVQTENDRMNSRKNTLTTYKAKNYQSNTDKIYSKPNMPEETSVSFTDKIVLQNQVLETIPLKSPTLLEITQTTHQKIISPNNLIMESKQIVPVIAGVSRMPEGATPINPLQIKENKKLSSNNKYTKAEIIADQNSEESSSLRSTIKKGFFSFLSKNAKKWTKNTLSFKNDKTNEHPILAVHFKNEMFEFSKEIKLGNF